MSEIAGVIKAKYGDVLRGRQDWIRVIDPEDQRCLIEVGLKAAQCGILGGKVRAKTARRSPEGKFVRADGTYEPRPKGFRETYQREPEAGRDYDPDGDICQDDYEFFTSIGRYTAHGSC